MMSLSRRKTSRLIVCLSFIVYLFPPLASLAENALVGQYYAEAYQAFQKGDSLKAKDLLLRLLGMRKDIPEAHNLLAVIYDRMGNTSMAESHFETAIRLKPDYLEARSNLALLLIRQGKLKGALDLAYKGFGPADVQFLVVTSLRQKKAYQKAFQQALLITRTYPDYPLAHLYAGIELQFQGELQQAESHYRRALFLAHNLPEVMTAAKFGLASTLSKEGNHGEAVPLLEELIRHNSRDIDARLELAEVYLRTRQYEGVLKTLEVVISSEPRNKRARFLMASALQRLGKQEEAKRHFGAFRDLENEQAKSKADRPSIYAKSRDE